VRGVQIRILARGEPRRNGAPRLEIAQSPLTGPTTPLFQLATPNSPPECPRPSNRG
jgi:hypothetical protein